MLPLDEQVAMLPAEGEKIADNCYEIWKSEQRQSYEANFAISPNPASRNLTVQFEHPINGTWKIIDINGKIQQSGTCVNQTMQFIELTDFATGVYIFSFQSENGSMSFQKFVVSK